MNNLFKVFTIEVPGQNLDDKRFYEYSDFDSNVMTTPTDAQVLQKAIAYTRMQQIKRKLSELTVPLYCNVEFTTEGNCSTIPTGAKLTVGYLSYEPFVSTVDPIPKEEAEQITTAQEVIKGIIDKALADGLEQELAFVQRIVSVPDNALVTTSEDLRDVYMDYIDVPKLDAVVSTVTFVKL
jgi:hypothetical protein